MEVFIMTPAMCCVITKHAGKNIGMCKMANCELQTNKIVNCKTKQKFVASFCAFIHIKLMSTINDQDIIFYHCHHNRSFML